MIKKLSLGFVVIGLLLLAGPSVFAQSTPQVTVQLEVANQSDTSSSDIVVGEEFDLVVRFVDASTNGHVFAGYTTLRFDPAILEVVGGENSVTYSQEYENLQLPDALFGANGGNFDAANGLIEGVGAVSRNFDVNNLPQETTVFTVRMKRIAPGTTTITSEAVDASNALAEVVVYGINREGDQRNNTAFGNQTLAQPIPGAINRLAPGSTSGTTLPDPVTEVTFSWDHDPNALAYELAYGSTVLQFDVANDGVDLGLTNADTLDCSNDVCEATVSSLAVDTTYEWYVRGSNGDRDGSNNLIPAGFGPWNQQAFIFTIPPPGLLSGLEPSGDLAANQKDVTFKWDHDPTATGYRLFFVSNETGDFFDQVISATDLACTDDNVCETTQSVLGNGRHEWYVQIAQPNEGRWAGPIAFVADLQPVTAVTNMMPDSSLPLDPEVTFSWTGSANADRYELYIIPPAGDAINETYPVASQGSAPVANASDTEVVCQNGTDCSITIDMQAENPGASFTGEYEWYARASNGGVVTSAWSSGANFSVGVPGAFVGQSPVNGASLPAGQAVDLTWADDPNATSFEVYVVVPGAPDLYETYDKAGQDVTCANDVCTLSYMPPNNGAYEWYGRTSNGTQFGAWGGPYSFSYGVAGAITGRGPADGTAFNTAQVTLTWDDDPSATSYEVYIAAAGGDPSFDTYTEAADGDGLTCDGTTCTLTVLGVAEGVNEWYVRGAGGPWSNAKTFNITNLPNPGAFMGQSPVNGASLPAGQAVDLTWADDPNADRYEVYIVVPGAADLYETYVEGQDVTCTNGVCTLSYTPPSNGAYEWYGRSSNGVEFGPWGGPFSFSVGVPGAFNGQSPVNGASLPAGQAVDLTWADDPNATSFEVYVVVPGADDLYETYDKAGQDVTCANDVCTLSYMPPNNGAYEWYGRTSNGTQFGTWGGPYSFSYGVAGAITGRGPADGTDFNTAQVTLTWDDDPNATSYEVYIAAAGGDPFYKPDYTEAADGDGLTCDGTTCTLTVLGVAEGVNEWYVRGAGGPWSNAKTFNITNLPNPGAFDALSPVNGASVQGGQNVEMTWTDDPNADRYEVYIVVPGAADFYETLVEGQDVTCANNVCTYIYTPPAANTDYEWYGRSSNGVEFGPWGGPFSFSIEPLALGNTEPLAPAEGAAIQPGN